MLYRIDGSENLARGKWEYNIKLTVCGFHHEVRAIKEKDIGQNPLKVLLSKVYSVKEKR